MGKLPCALLFFLLFTNSAFSWKKEEFRNCDQTPFCKRARSRQPGACSLTATDISISGGDLVAKLVAKETNQETPTKPLVLKISAYQDGVMRLKIDEDQDLNPRKKRFEVPDVIVPEFSDKKLWLQSLKEEEEENSGLISVVHLSDGYEGVIRHDPFEVFVRERGKNGKKVLSLNSNGLFDFEQIKDKKDENEDWEEKFRTHTDSRPYGPQSISFDVSFYGADFVYGIPEHATSLALKPTSGSGVEASEPYRLFNLDVFEYIHDSPFGLYGSIPFMISHGKSRGSSGFFWLNAAEMQIDVFNGNNSNEFLKLPSDQKRIDTLWMSEAGVVDAFFFVGPAPKDVVRQYASVTGPTALPQLFSIAYHQCRWNYRDEEDVYNVDSKFDEHDIPYDVLWLDIEHTDGKKYFTWDKMLFPNPEEMQNKLAAKGRRMVTIVDPHIKRDDSYFIHEEASKKGYYVKDKTGNDFDGWCWPGSSSYLDMVDPKIRSWWGEKFSCKNYVGSTPSLYIWNDMNEPSVFNGPEVTMPRDDPKPPAKTRGNLWMEFPSDEKTFSNDEAFMVGNSLLVQGIYTQGAKHAEVYLPGYQPWYDFKNGNSYKGGETYKLDVLEDSVPSFIRGGTILPRKDRFRRSSTQMANDPYTLVIALNQSMSAEGELYIDDGKSFEFQKGAYIHRRFTFSNGKLTSSNMRPDDTTAGDRKFETESTVERIILLGLSNAPKNAVIEPANQKVEIEMGPLLLRGGRGLSVPTIRKPDVRIGDDWTIKLL
ncbi:PREDICTED: probable glucan 1,3-alpha-glucosidase [Erythranthe guttata]|nr:PREDICTED: probable glucan 1,3-alpha-glucosidase [Erythranthe guttata]|eukprot:XP_012844831.1 PREDICTED: probable glucan 1,3-alpha-glucosidase [Erythranthe guttata]